MVWKKHNCRDNISTGRFAGTVGKISLQKSKTLKTRKNKF